MVCYSSVILLLICCLAQRTVGLAGKPVGEHEYPWLAHITSYSIEADSFKSCAASLISADTLLTTATCVTFESRNRSVITADSALIRFGKYDLKVTHHGADEPTFFTKDIIIHPNSSYFDFAAIKLSNPLRSNFRMFPVPLTNWVVCENKSAVCDNGIVIGWGMSTSNHNEYSQPHELEFVKTAKLSDADCRQHWNNVTNSPSGRFCAAPTISSEQMCQVADHGSPYLCRVDGELMLHGTTGIGGYSDSGQLSCDMGSVRPAYFSNVCSVLPWLQSMNFTIETSRAQFSDMFRPLTVGDLRLDGGLNNVGYLQIYYNNSWGSICDDSFDAPDIQVACRQLGFSARGGSMISGSAEKVNYGLVNSAERIYLDNLNCRGDELSLLECPKPNGVGEHNCGHSEDVALICMVDDGTIGVANDYPEVPGVEGNIKLTGGPSPDAGYLQIYHDGEWGTVCDDSFGTADAKVVCRQLGYSPSSAVVGLSSSLFTAPLGVPIWLDDMACQGDEEYLANCTHRAWGSNNCGHSEDVIMSCSNETESGGIEGQVRLTGGMSEHNGTVGFVEIYHNGRWGSVCDDMFDSNAAQVVCRQLGHGYSALAVILSTSSPSVLLTTQGIASRIWLDSVSCNGREVELSECDHDSWGVNDCSRSEDVAISCVGDLSTSLSRASTAELNRFFTVVERGDYVAVRNMLRNSSISPNVRGSECCANIDGASGYEESTALICSSCSGDHRTGLILIASGADLEARDSETGGTALIWAARHGNVGLVSLLVKSGADINAKTLSYNDSALMWAAYKGHLNIVRILVENGASLTDKQNGGQTAAMIARREGRSDVVEFLSLLSGNKEIEIESMTQDQKNEQLFLDIINNNGTGVQDIITRGGADVNSRYSVCCTYSNATALICASCQGSYGAVISLVQKGANLEDTDRDGGTALIWASRAGFNNIVRYLLKKGAMVNAATNHQDTALTFAAYSGNYDVVRELVHQGADICHRQSGGNTPAELARNKRYSSISDFLNEKDDCTSSSSSSSSTPRLSGSSTQSSYVTDGSWLVTHSHYEYYYY